jgi:peroxiredoxin Q/BCP
MPATAKKAPAKKATATKAVAKKPAAKKTPVKKPAAKAVAAKPAPAVKSLREGAAAPACSLALTGNKNVDLASFKGKKNVVLYFYPKDDTPGCTIEANDFAKLNAQFTKADTVVIGISKDDMKSHDKFRAKYDLPFALASDASGITEAFGAWGEKSMYGKTYFGIVRSTFLIDKAGKVAKAWPKVSVTGHAAEVLNAAQGLK